jgi:transcriptional regulator with XRE-family HTH domain|nr:MAG TPA: Transcriptional regulator, Transcriptional activator, TPR, HTH [Caudoviricetes sp.]
MVDLHAFRKVNKLKQEDLAKYLNTTRAFISMVETGASKLPPEKLSLLLNNTQGWDTKMLVDNGGIYAGNNNAGDVNVQIGQNRAGNRPKDGDAVTQMAVLEKENEMLREQLKDKEAQIDFLRALVKNN